MKDNGSKINLMDQVNYSSLMALTIQVPSHMDLLMEMEDISLAKAAIMKGKFDTMLQKEKDHQLTILKIILTLGNG